MRVRLSIVGAGVALLLGACTSPSAQGAKIVTPTLSPTPRPTIPAADAGGACAVLDFDRITAALGVRFDVAAAGRQGKTDTCVVRSSEANLPDLVLTISPTTADASVFRSEMAPAKAKTVKALGRAAYRGTVAAGKRLGPVAEVGWLSKDKRMLTLRYTFPVGASAASADRLSTRLVSLAKTIESTRA